MFRFSFFNLAFEQHDAIGYFKKIVQNAIRAQNKEIWSS